jgi:hypothetical protein
MFEIFTTVKILIVIFWVMISCNPVCGYQRFDGTYDLLLQAVLRTYPVDQCCPGWGYCAFISSVSSISLSELTTVALLGSTSTETESTATQLLLVSNRWRCWSAHLRLHTHSNNGVWYSNFIMSVGQKRILNAEFGHPYDMGKNTSCRKRSEESVTYVNFINKEMSPITPRTIQLYTVTGNKLWVSTTSLACG